MRLSDIMSHAGLTVFPEIGLIIFLAVFGAVVWRICFRRQSAELELLGHLPLNDQLTSSNSISEQQDSHEAA